MAETMRWALLAWALWQLSGPVQVYAPGPSSWEEQDRQEVAQDILHAYVERGERGG